MKIKSLYWNKEKKIWETEENSPYFKEGANISFSNKKPRKTQNYSKLSHPRAI